MILGTAKRNKEGAKPLPTRSYSSKQEKTVSKAVCGNRRVAERFGSVRQRRHRAGIK
jgi:hypothetical protein